MIQTALLASSSSPQFSTIYHHCKLFSLFTLMFTTFHYTLMSNSTKCCHIPYTANHSHYKHSFCGISVFSRVHIVVEMHLAVPRQIFLLGHFIVFHTFVLCWKEAGRTIKTNVATSRAFLLLSCKASYLPLPSNV